MNLKIGLDDSEAQRKIDGLAEDLAGVQRVGGKPIKIDVDDKAIDALVARLGKLSGGGALAFNNITGAVGNLSNSLTQLSQPLVNLDAATQAMKAIGPEAAKMAEGLKSAAITASRDVPFAAAEMMESYNDAIASGVQGGEAEIAKFGTVAAKLAVSSSSDVEAARGVLAGVLNSYGKTAADADGVADQLWNTVNAGVLSMDEMSASFANVLPTAAAMKVGLGDVGGSLARLTQLNIPFAQATTKMNAMLLEFSKPGATLAPILQKAGVTAEDFAKDFTGSMGKVDAAMKASGTNAIKSFSSSEAAASFNALASDLGKLKQSIDDVGTETGTGTVNASFEEMKEGIGVKTKLMVNYVQSFITQGLDKLGGGFIAAANAGAQLAPVFTSFASLKTLVPEGLVAKLTGGNGLTGAMSTVSKGIGSMGSSLGAFATGPVGIAIAAIGLIVGAFVLLYNTSDEFRAAVDDLVATVMEFVSALWDAVKPALTQVWELLKDLAGFIIDVVVAYFTLWWEAVKAVVGIFLDLIAKITGTGTAAKLLSSILAGVRVVFEKVKFAILAVRVAIGGIKAAFEVAVTALKAFITAVGDWSPGAALKAFDGLGGKMSAAFQQGAAAVMRESQGGWGDDMTEAGKAAEPAAADAGDGVGGAAGGAAAKAMKAKAKDAIVGFVEEVARLGADVKALTGKLGVEEAADPIEKFKKEYAEKARLAEAQIIAERAALQKKYDDAAAGKKKLSTAEGARLQDALLLLADKEIAVMGLLAAERLKGLEGLAKATLAAEAKTRNESNDAYLASLKAQEEVITGTTAKEIAERTRLKLEALDIEQDKALEAAIAPLMAEKLAILEMGRLQGIYTKEEVAGEAEKLRAKVLNSVRIKTLLTKQAQDRKAIELTAATELTAAQEAEFRKANLLYGVAVDFRSAMLERMGSASDTAALTRLKEVQVGLDKETTALKASLDNREIDYATYSAKLGEIDRKRSDAQAEMAAAQFDVFRLLGESAAVAFQKVQADSTATLNKGLADFLAGNSSYETALTDLATITGAVVGEAAATSNKIGQDSAKKMAEIMLAVLEAQTPAIIALILGKEFISSGPLGFITSAILTGAFLGAIGIAKNALKGIDGYAEGGLVGGKKRLAWLNDDPMQRPEYVIKGDRVARFGPDFFDVLNYGSEKDIAALFTKGVQGVAVGMDPKEARETRKELKALRKTMDKVAREFSSTHHVNVSGKLTADAGSLGAALHHESMANALRG